MNLASMAILGVGSLMVTLSLNLLAGWTLDTMCPGSESFCGGVYWTAVVKYLPTWLYIGQIMVVLALASPVALVSMRGR